MPLPAGTLLGRFEIIESIGAGGMGDVYAARDPRLHRTVAIKVCREELSARFEREARGVAALNHPHICTLHDIGPNYLVMELVEGNTLAARSAQGPLPATGAIRIARQIAEALTAAHDARIVHRDLKPANIKITPAGLVKVLDFGLARTDEDPSAAAEAPTITGPPRTVAGVAIGTVAYMSPEQAQGLPVDQLRGRLRRRADHRPSVRAPARHTAVSLRGRHCGRPRATRSAPNPTFCGAAARCSTRCSSTPTSATRGRCRTSRWWYGMP
jgi:serine/threonine-protein kinase